MPKWSLKGIFSRSDTNSQAQDNSDGELIEDDTETPGDLSMPGMAVSPLAMMDERRPEAWLGNFLAITGAPPALNYSTIAAAQQDQQLRAHLQEIWEQAMEHSPASMLDSKYADALKAKDWAAWWRGQEALGRYAYSILALALLGDRSHNAELADLYRQDGNSRIKKDAHYTLTYILGKSWPAYTPTEADLSRLTSS